MPTTDRPRRSTCIPSTVNGGEFIGTDGLGGTDTLVGIEAIWGGSGADTIDASQMAYGVSLFGGAGDDMLYGSDYNDTLVGGAGFDQFFGGGGRDTVTYAGNAAGAPVSSYVSGILIVDDGFGAQDYLNGITVMIGTSGNDTLSAAGLATGIEFDGNGGNDSLTGGSGNDTLIAGDGNSTLAGGAGDDLLVSKNGHALFLPGAGNDTVESGGFATVSYAGNDASQPIWATSTSVDMTKLIVADGQDGQDILYSAQTVVGGAGNDTLDCVYDWYDNAVAGGPGNDLILGSQIGTAISGDGGNDTISTNLLNGSFTETIDGGPGRDALIVPETLAATSLQHQGGTSWTVLGPAGILSVANIELVRFIDATLALGTAPTHDFLGSGTDDVLWRNDDGSLRQWQVQNGAIIGGGCGAVDKASTVQGVGDFNNDGQADILWRYTDGTVGLWTMNGRRPRAAAGSCRSTTAGR